MGAFTNEKLYPKYWTGNVSTTWDTSAANFNVKSDGSGANGAFVNGRDAVFNKTGSYAVSVSGTVSPNQMQITAGSPTFNSGTISATGLRMSNTGGTTAVNSTLKVSGTFSATGGTMTLGADAEAGTAEFSNYVSSNYAVNTGANTLNVTSEMRLANNYVVQGAFGVKSVAGSNIADNGAARTIVLATANGTVTLKKAMAPGGTTAGQKPIRYWSFNDSAAPWKEDSGAGVSDGAAVNGIAWMAAGKVGGGMNEGGNTKAYLNLDTGSTKPSFATGSQWTVSAWYNNISNVTGYRTLFRGGVNDIPILLNIGTYTLGTFSGGAFVNCTTPYTLTDAQKTGWHFIAAVGGENGPTDNTTKFYIDGALVGTASAKINSTITLVGGHSDGQRFADGLDEVYAYNRALSSTEITHLMNAAGVGSTLVDLQTTHISATASSTLDLADVTPDHKLGDVTVMAGADSDTTLTVANVNSLTIGTLTIGINGAHWGKLDVTGKMLTLGNGSVPKLAVTSISPTVKECCVAVAAAGSFSSVPSTVVDNNGRTWNVETRSGGTQLWLVAAPGGAVFMFR
jgi:hypothetical protein